MTQSDQVHIAIMNDPIVDTLTLQELTGAAAAQESGGDLNPEESSDAAAADVTVTSNDDVTSENPPKEQNAAATTTAVDTEEDSGDEGNASDIDRKLLVDATVVGKSRGSRNRKPLPNHAPDVDDKARPWLWKPPSYILDGGDSWTSGQADEHPSSGGHPTVSSGGATVNPPVPQTISDGQIGADSEMDCRDEAQGASAAATRSEAELLGSSKEEGGVHEPPEDKMEVVDENGLMQQDEETPVTRKEKELDEGEEGVAKGGDEEVQEKWKGLLLEGLKESARWPIRKESLMSMDFLVETGVLPKV